MSRGRRAGLGFDVIVHIHDASAVVYTCSSSRRPPDPLPAGRFRNRFPPRLFTGMTLRRFWASACTATPEDLPPSQIEHVSFWRSSTSSSLHFQDTPRTRLTDALHRRCSATRARQARFGLGATTSPLRLTRPSRSGSRSTKCNPQRRDCRWRLPTKTPSL